MAKRPKAQMMMARAKATPPVDPLSDPRLQKLAGRFADIRSHAYRFVVDSSRDGGQVLEAGRKILPDKRDFNRWSDSLDVSRGTAVNFINVSKLARHAPGQYERWRSLGPAKIYRVARLEPAAREAVLAAPGIDQMNDADFALLCSPHEESLVEVTGNMLGNGLVQKALGMGSKLDRWELPEITSKELRKKLRAGLLDLARKARELARQL